MASTTANINNQEQSTTSPLKTLLHANGAFCEAAGIIAILSAPVLAETIGAGTPMFYRILGLLTFLHGAFLFINGRQDNPKLWVGYYMQAGDILWIIASAILIFADPFNITTGGKWLIGIVADMVLLFAIVQFFVLRKLN